MQSRKRPFYIIGHNPNTIEEAEECLRSGANALEPDVVHAGGRFYISHAHHSSYEDAPTLESYLKALKELINARSFNLALLIFDLKDVDFNIDDLVSLVKENFRGDRCDEVALLFTNSDDHDFIAGYTGTYPNVGIGVDESNVPPAELEQAFKKAGHKNFCYADGITSFLTKTGVFENIRSAQQHRDKDPHNSFTLVYTWVLSLEGSLCKYLDTHIDGIFVDPASVSHLKKLLENEPYKEAYELAVCGHNPFTADPIPTYTLAVKTSDKLFAGTDAQIVFTLKSKSGLILKSLPYNSDRWGALERGTTTCLSIEGINLGEIESLTLQALTTGPGADWLPECITIESYLLAKKFEFCFNGEGLTEEWVTLKDGAVTKFPFS